MALRRAARASPSMSVVVLLPIYARYDLTMGKTQELSAPSAKTSYIAGNSDASMRSIPYMNSLCAARSRPSLGNTVTFSWTPRARNLISLLMTQNQTIDARDLLCPLPVLRLRKALEKAPLGARIQLLATDPAAAIDVPHFCAEQGHDYIGSEKQKGDTTAYTVRKTA